MNAEPREDTPPSARIFVSYARQDDFPSPDEPNVKGFVTFLQERLLYEFSRLGPPHPELYSNERWRESDDQFPLDDEIRRADILLVVLSPNWMSSRWCRTEFDTFVGRFTAYEAEERIFVVRKNVVSEEIPSALRSLQDFPLFEFDPESGRSRDLFVRGKTTDDAYFDRVRVLARHLWAKCEQLGASTADTGAQGASAEAQASIPNVPPPAPEVILEQPDRVLELLFRFASRFPNCHEILVTAQLENFRTARDIAVKEVPLTSDVRAWLEQLAANLGTEPIHPSALWLAWMKQVQLRKLVPVAQQLLAEWSPQPQAKNP